MNKVKCLILYTHGTGPGLLGVVVNLLKSYLGGCVKSKLERHHTLDPTLPCPLTSYVDKIGNIVKMVVCEPEEGEMPSGKLKKIGRTSKRRMRRRRKRRKHKSNVKFTERKSSKQVSSEDASDDSDAALVVGSSDEEDFTTLTSGGWEKNSTGHPTRQDKKPRFRG